MNKTRPSKGAGFVDKKNEVHKNCIHAENIKKEHQYSARNRSEEYSLNPFTMQNISEKPNYVTPLNPYKSVKVDNIHDDVVERAFRLNSMRKKIQSAGMAPRQKFAFQQTSSQEIGWFNQPLVKPADRWQHGVTNCQITKYADNYMELKKTNPFKVRQR